MAANIRNNFKRRGYVCASIFTRRWCAMPPFKDITGEEHGNLIVLGLSDHKYVV